MSSTLNPKRLGTNYCQKPNQEMKVILEIEYHASEWSSLSIFKILNEHKIAAKIFKMRTNLAESNLEKDQQVYYSISFIKKVVSSETNMPEKFFEMSVRKQEIAETRQIAMYLCRKYTRKSLREIGHEFGNKTPATIMHACKAVENLLHTDKLFRSRLATIEMILNSA
jgi:chromosomal replication initiation ATPase DnaA